MIKYKEQIKNNNLNGYFREPSCWNCGSKKSIEMVGRRELCSGCKSLFK